MFNVLVVEDDKNLRKLITTCLKRENYQTYEATNGMEALEILDKNYIDLMVTDIMMPEMDGYELTRELRNAKYNIPILLITAKSTLSDKKEGFLSGADDYMVKPIDIEELSLRVKVLLKRSNMTNEKKIKIGDLILNYNQLSVIKGEKNYQLAQKEFYLLYKLLSYPDKIFTRIELMDEIWGYETDSDDTTINVHVNRLRKRFDKYPEFEIKAIRGLGYKAVKKIEE